MAFSAIRLTQATILIVAISHLVSAGGQRAVTNLFATSAGKPGPKHEASSSFHHCFLPERLMPELWSY